MVDRRLLTTRQAADLLNVHPNTIRRLVHRGRLKVVKLESRALRFDQDDLSDYINRQRRDGLTARARSLAGLGLLLPGLLV